MNPLRKTVIRLVVYGIVVGWIVGDLFVWHGPLRRRMDLADSNSEAAIERAKKEGAVARVFNHLITRTQLERAVAWRLWREGKTLEDVPAGDRLRLRYAALDELIDHELLRVKAKANGPDLRVDEAEWERRYQRFVDRFASEEEMEDAARSQGIGGKKEVRERIAAWMQQEAYVESKIRPLVVVTEDELRAWWEAHADQLAHPEMVELRHIFLPSLDVPEGEAEAKIRQVLADLQSRNETFEGLAAKVSQDAASRERGGSLGWIARGRLSVEFEDAVFALETGKPAVVRSRIGWHLVEVTGRKPAIRRSFEEARAEVEAAVMTVKRDRAVREFCDALRRFEAAKIRVFPDMIAGE